MLKKIFSFIILFPILISAQVVHELNDRHIQYTPTEWTASWISHSSVDTNNLRVLYFRKHVNISVIPDSFIIHLSAVNHYYLYVNEVLVTTGPAESDINHWRYETIDIASFLHNGKNTIAVQIDNRGKYIVNSLSSQTAFLLQGHSQQERIVNSDESWKVLESKAYRINATKPGDLTSDKAHFSGDSIIGKHIPLNWTKPSFEDSEWQFASTIHVKHTLTPRSVPLLQFKPESIKKIVSSTGIQITENPFNGKDSLIIGKNMKVSLLIDQQKLSFGIPRIITSKGKESTIKMIYAEAMVFKNKIKGNRNDIRNKIAMGICDVIIPDGSARMAYSPLSLRTFRYLLLEVETKNEALIIHQLEQLSSTSDIKFVASYSSENKDLQQIWDLCLYTNQLCAQDILIHDASWDQSQNLISSRIHALSLLYLSGDDRLIRNAIEQFSYSMNHNRVYQNHSLLWIDMIYDYLMYQNDKDFIHKFLPQIISILNDYTSTIDENSLTKGFTEKQFVDWYKEAPNGEPKGAHDGGSSVLALQLVYSLQHAASIFQSVGNKQQADMYNDLADKIKLSVYNHCWVSEKGLIAETPLKTSFTQHTNIMAVLTNTVSQGEYRPLMEKVVSGIGMWKTSSYFDFYFFEALRKAQMPEEFYNKLSLWKSYLNMGLTTTPEPGDNSRTDCTPLTAHPGYYLLSFAGIYPTNAGFETLRIAPQPGQQKTIKASMPIPQGTLHIDLQRKGKKGMRGMIILPANTKGELIWNKKIVPLKEGKQKVMVK